MVKAMGRPGRSSSLLIAFFGLTWAGSRRFSPKKATTPKHPAPLRIYNGVMVRLTRLRIYLALFLMIGLAFSLFWHPDTAPAALASASSPSKPMADARAQKVDRIFNEIEEDHANGRGSGKTYLLAEDELNAYLTEKLREQERKDVEKITIRLQHKSFTTHIQVNMDEVQVKDTMTANLFKALFRGRQKIEVDGELKTNDGQGTYEVQRARVNDVGVPAIVVNTILSSVGRQQDPPFDPTEPFDIPYGIKTIRIQQGKVRIDT
jgi:hypothetical protein